MQQERCIRYIKINKVCTQISFCLVAENVFKIKKKDQIDIKIKLPTDSAEYQLIATLNLRGRGHFVCFLKDPTISNYDDGMNMINLNG